MIRMFFCLHRLPALDFDEFQAYWRDHHAPMVRERAEILRIRRYVQSRTTAPDVSHGLQAVRDAPAPYDGVASLWFDSMEDLHASAESPEGRRAARELLEDERTFIDLARSPIWLAVEEEML